MRLRFQFTVFLFDFFRPFTASGSIVTVSVPLPYVVFKNIFPLYGMGGMPVRFILFTYLGIAVCISLSALWLARSLRPVGSLLILLLFTAVPAIEYLNTPFSIAAFAPRPQEVMESIRREPAHVAVLTDDWGVLSQKEVILHEHPVNAGSLSRVPDHQHDMQATIRAMIDAWHPRNAGRKAEYLAFLRTHNFKYFLTRRMNQNRHAFIVDVLGGKHLHSGPEMHVYLLYE